MEGFFFVSFPPSLPHSLSRFPFLSPLPLLSEQEWVQIGYSSASADALPLFLNRLNGRMTYEMPEVWGAGWERK